MKNQIDIKNIILNYGLYLGFITIFSHLILYATGTLLKFSWITGVLGFIAMIVLIVLGIKRYKIDNRGYLSFGEALKIGVGIAVFSATISVIYTLIFTNFIDPDLVNHAMELQKQKWLESGMSEEQIDASFETAKKFQNPAITSAFSIIVQAFFGFIISAVVGAVMKKDIENEY